MTEPQVSLTEAARDWVRARGGALTVRASPQHGCCGGHAAVPQAEARTPDAPEGYDCFAVDGVTVHLASGLAPGPYRVDLEGFWRWRRLTVAGPVSAWRAAPDPYREPRTTGNDGNPMLNHLLVAHDFSPAWPRLQAWLRQMPSLGCRKITLAYVIESGYTQAPELSHREYYEQRLSEAADALAREAGLVVDWTVRVGAVAPELVAAARAHGADTILAGSQGHGRLYRFLLGDSVLDLARIADRPLLLVPVHDDAPEPSGVTCRPMLATDGSDAAAGAEAAFLHLLPKCRKGVVVSVGRWDERAEAADERERLQAHVEALAARAGEAAFDVELVGRGRPSEEIVRVATAREADLILIGRRGRNPMTELLLGSTAEAVCRGSRWPVLLVPATAMIHEGALVGTDTEPTG
ncbi:MAG: universal stress protein [Halofilum sp. (in: g-proteobacteria)]|nr:universal stress protein [Halofilum sp. (in: g-proteobacteria)]